MSSKKKVIENSVLYTMSSLLLKSAGFLLLPIYTRFLTPTDYGITNLASSFTQVATYVIAFSLYSALVRFYTDYSVDRETLKRFYGSIISFIGLMCITSFILMIVLRDLINRWFFDNLTFYPIILVTFVMVVFITLHSTHESILQGMQQGKKLTAINIIFFVLQVLLNLLLIGFFRLGALGVLLSTMILNIAYFFFMIYDLKKNNLVTFCFDKEILKEALTYSIPIMPHNLSTSVAGLASRVFINNSGSLYSVGLYSIAMQFGLLIDLVQSSVNKAFAPWFYDVMNKGEHEKHPEIKDLSHILLTLYSILYMLIGLFSQEAIFIMTNENYLMAWTVVPILVIAFSIKSIYYFYINLMFYYKEATKKIFISTLIGSFMDIFLSFILIPYYGMYGAAVAFLIAKAIIVIIVLVFSRKYNTVGYKIGNMLKVVLTSLIFMGIGLYFSLTRYMVEFNWLNVFYKFIVLFIYLAYIYIINHKVIKVMFISLKEMVNLKRNKNNEQ